MLSQGLLTERQFLIVRSGGEKTARETRGEDVQRACVFTCSLLMFACVCAIFSFSFREL